MNRKITSAGSEIAKAFLLCESAAAMEYASTVLVLEYRFWGTRTRNPWYSVSTRRSMYSVLEGQCTRYSVKKRAEYMSTFGFR